MRRYRLVLVGRDNLTIVSIVVDAVSKSSAVGYAIKEVRRLYPETSRRYWRIDKCYLSLQQRS